MPGRPDRAQFAKLLGVSRNTVARYETNQADKPIVLMRWAEVTGFAYEWLTGDFDPESPAKVPVSERRGVWGSPPPSASRHPEREEGPRPVEP